MEELYTQEIIKNKPNRYEHITKRKRDIISKHLSAGKRISYIAKALNRSKSSISEDDVLFFKNAILNHYDYEVFL